MVDFDGGSKIVLGGGYGFDIRANEAKYGKVRIINNSKYHGRVPLKNEKADCVFMLAVLEHLPVDTPLLSEAVRVLKRNGYFIVTTPAPAAKPVLEFLSFRLHLVSEESINSGRHFVKNLFPCCLVISINLLQLGFWEFPKSLIED